MEILVQISGFSGNGHYRKRKALLLHPPTRTRYHHPKEEHELLTLRKYRREVHHDH